MLEFLFVPLVAGGVVAIKASLSERMNDRKKLEKVFIRTKCFAVDYDKQGRGYKKMPVPLGRPKHLERSTMFAYRLPIGLPTDAINIRKEVIEEALGKKVEIEIDKNIVRIFAFNEGLPTKINLNATERTVEDEDSTRC